MHAAELHTGMTGSSLGKSEADSASFRSASFQQQLVTRKVCHGPVAGLVSLPASAPLWIHKAGTSNVRSTSNCIINKLVAACSGVRDYPSQPKPRLPSAASSGQAYLLVAGESIGVDDPEAAAEVPCLAVRGLLPAPFSPPLSLRLSMPLLGSEFGVLSLGVPELLRRSSRSPAGDSPGEAALEGACSSADAVMHAMPDTTHSHLASHGQHT